eukprot:7184695-Prymnesium_polylepis.1
MPRASGVPTSSGKFSGDPLELSAAMTDPEGMKKSGGAAPFVARAASFATNSCCLNDSIVGSSSGEVSASSD